MTPSARVRLSRPAGEPQRCRTLNKLARSQQPPDQKSHRIRCAKIGWTRWPISSNQDLVIDLTEARQDVCCEWRWLDDSLCWICMNNSAVEDGYFFDPPRSCNSSTRGRWFNSLMFHYDKRARIRDGSQSLTIKVLQSILIEIELGPKTRPRLQPPPVLFSWLESEWK